MREKPLHPCASLLCRSCRKEFQWGESNSPYCSQACLEVETSAAALKEDGPVFLPLPDEEWTPTYSNPDNA